MFFKWQSRKPGEGTANSYKSTSLDHWGVLILLISSYSRDWKWLWQLQSLQSYTLTWGFLMGTETKGTDVCITPDIKTSMSGFQVPAWEEPPLKSLVTCEQPHRATLSHHKHLCQWKREAEDPLSPPSHLLRKEEYPLIFFFSEMKAASFTPHLLEDHCHLRHPQHRAGSNWEQKVTTTS